MTDWVTERHNCTSKGAIAALAKQAKKDVATRNGQITGNLIHMPQLEFQSYGDEGFSIIWRYDTDAKPPERDVRFARTGPQLIQVNGSAFDIPLYVQVAMNDQCECELSVDHQSLSYSQVLYKALHRLFFPPETQQT